MTDYLYEEIDAGNVCVLVSLDLSKAFDKVNRDLLLCTQDKILVHKALAGKDFAVIQILFTSKNLPNGTLGPEGFVEYDIVAVYDIVEIL